MFTSGAFFQRCGGLLIRSSVVGLATSSGCDHVVSPYRVTCCVLSLNGHSFSPHGGSTTSRNVNLIFLDCR